MIRTFSVIFFSMLLLAACSSHKSKFKPLPMNQMKIITWDLMKASEWHQFIINKDSTAKNRKEDIRLYAQVFAIHGITKDQYYDSYKYYEAHPMEFKILADSIDAYGLREKARFFEKHDPAR